MPLLTTSQYADVVADLTSKEYYVASVPPDIMHAMMGVASEAGEVTDALKATVFYGKPLDLTNLDEEFGDILWYIQCYCNARGKRLEHLMTQNAAKLAVRYGARFDRARSLLRDLVAERKSLEQTGSTTE